MTPTNLTLLERCRCGAHLELDEEPHRGHIVTCPVCFDPSAEDASPIERLAGVGATPADAFANYMTRREERDLEPSYNLSELASFIVPPPPPALYLVHGVQLPTLKRATTIAEGVGVFPPDPILYTPLMGEKAANQ